MLAVEGVVVLAPTLLLTAPPVGNLFSGPPLGPDRLSTRDQVVRFARATLLSQVLFQDTHRLLGR